MLDFQHVPTPLLVLTTYIIAGCSHRSARCELKKWKWKRPADGVITAFFYVLENSAKEQNFAEN